MDSVRRNAVRSLALLLAVAPAIGLAQASGSRPKRVAVILGPSTAPDPIGPTRKWYAGEFAKHGFVDGRDIEIAIFRQSRKQAEEEGIDVAVATPVRHAVALRPAVILTLGGSASVKNYYLPVTGDIPLVVFGPEDPSEDSIEDLHRRGANVTGVMNAYFELVAKRFELMKELRPGARRAASLSFLEPSVNPWQSAWDLKFRANYAAVARSLGMEFEDVKVALKASPATMVQVLRRAQIDLVEVQVVLDGGADAEKQLFQLLAGSGILAAGILQQARNGALLSGWSEGWVESAIRLAAKIVRGARVADLPVERAREFRLAMNLRTAKTLGITVPASVLLRVDEVFE